MTTNDTIELRTASKPIERPTPRDILSVRDSPPPPMPSGEAVPSFVDVDGKLDEGAVVEDRAEDIEPGDNVVGDET
jgi:hypothetical protein